MRRLVEIVASESGGDWELYANEQDGQVVATEITTAGHNIYERTMIVEEVRGLMNAAKAGKLVPFVEIKDIRRKPSVFELKWKLGGDQYSPERMWRLYFMRWANLGPFRLALRFAQKHGGLRGKLAQNADIDLAWDRYKEWSARTGTR